MLDLTIQELMRGVQLETGMLHRLRIRFPELRVRLPIDPRQAEHWDDRFVLTMVRDGAETQTVMTVMNDHLAGDACVDLVFKRLMPDARYTLVIESGEPATSCALFEDRAHDELFGL